MGCATWPDEPIYAKCVDCGEPTTPITNATSDLLDADEARSRLSHAEFEEYYARREALRNRGELEDAERAAERLADELGEG